MTVGIIITYIVLGILFALLFARSDYKDECEARDINMDDKEYANKYLKENFPNIFFCGLLWIVFIPVAALIGVFELLFVQFLTSGKPKKKTGELPVFKGDEFNGFSDEVYMNLIKILDNEIICNERDVTTDCDCTCDSCPNYIEQEKLLSAYRKIIEILHRTSWTPCSVRQPPEDGEYLVTVCSETVQCKVDIYDYTVSRKWGSAVSNEMVKAWMPKPEVFKNE